MIGVEDIAVPAFLFLARIVGRGDVAVVGIGSGEMPKNAGMMVVAKAVEIAATLMRSA